MSFRKLSKEESLAYARALVGQTISATRRARFEEFVRKYYPGAACVQVSYASEYNDSTYDNRVAFVTVLDAAGNELRPLRDKAKEAHRAALQLPLPEGRYETRESAEDEDEFVFVGDQCLPDLYVRQED